MKEKIINLFLDSKKQNKVLLSTVSGVASTKPGLISFFNDDIEAINIITTKSFQVTPNLGNREPIVCEVESGTFGNSVGLRNPGMEVALNELKTLRSTCNLNKILNVSVSASSPEDFITLIKNFSEVADMFELNFSCPHAASGYGASIGSDKEIASLYVSTIVKALPNLNTPIFVKLTPNVNNIGEIAKACVSSGADGITAINTVGPELYIEPHSKMAILNNKLGGKGGKSGAQVFEVALNAIAEISKVIGPNVPILAMGGVSTGEEAYKLLEAGGHAVGIGSSLARVHQDNWAKYLQALKLEAQSFLQKTPKPQMTTSEFLSTKKLMEYTPYKVTSLELLENETVLLLTLDGKIKYSAGEFVFLWLPEIGEKPFTIALSEPLTFLVKKRGVFTQGLFNIKVGDIVYVRGPYGAGVKIANTKKAYLVAGGTGVAVLPQLAKNLSEAKVEVKTLVGSTYGTGCRKASNIIERALESKGSFSCIADDGEPGRVLQVLIDEVKQETCDLKDIAFYIVGPTPFFTKAASMLEACGVKAKNIYLSLEKETRCGVGLCGECSCGKKLTCHHGTFFTYDEYN